MERTLEKIIKEKLKSFVMPKKGYPAHISGTIVSDIYDISRYLRDEADKIYRYFKNEILFPLETGAVKLPKSIKADYVLTIKRFIINDCSYKKTAQDLGVHYSVIIRRLFPKKREPPLKTLFPQVQEQLLKLIELIKYKNKLHTIANNIKANTIKRQTNYSVNLYWRDKFSKLEDEIREYFITAP